MSDAEEEEEENSSASSEEEEAEEEPEYDEPEDSEEPIYAVAPSVNIQDEGSIDVATCPAFQSLDELFYAGLIPGTRVAELKAKYTLLHDTLVSLQESEIQLLQDAKRFTAIIEEQQEKLEKAEQFPEESTSELSKLRQQYLRYHNEYNAIQEREFEIQYKLNSLLEDKKLLEKEYCRIPKASDAERRIKVLKDSCEEIRKETTHRRQEIKALKEDLSSRQKHLTRDQKDLDELFRKQEELKDDLVHLQSIPIQIGKEVEKISRRKQGSLEMSFRNCVVMKQKLHDVLSRMQRERERDFRNFKKMEMQLRIAQEGLEQVKLHHERILLEIDAVPKDDGTLLERRRELQREVEIAKRNLTQEKTSTDVEGRMLEQCVAEEDQLFKALEHYRDDVANLIRMTQLKADEREQKSKDFLKAQIRLNSIVREIKTKDFEIREYKKKQKSIQRQMKEYAKMYDIVRNERNKLVNFVHAARQKTAEMKDRVKMLDNDMELLRNNAIIKDRKLQKYQLKLANNMAIKDSIHNDVCKVLQTLQEMKEKREQQLMDVERLTNMLTRVEEEMVQLRKQYERAVQRRNESGVLLIEREEEVCIFYEKINIQEMMSRNGDIEINVMNEKIRFLKMKLTEKKRQIELSLKTLPMKRGLDADLVVLQIQYSQCKDKIKSLEKMFTDPNRENRTRALPGKDLSQAELFKKIEALEIKLAQKEEKLLEKDFIYEQVSRLTEKIHTKVENGKGDTLILAKKMNRLQMKIKTTTQAMMALIAELSMNQAHAIKLQQEMRDKEHFLTCVTSRLEKGLPLPKEVETAWLKVLRDEEMHKAAAAAKAKRTEEEEQYLLPTSVYTTAEQRPNAYIPDDESVLPLPKPYGALAPFKPGEPSANMRHIRKPLIKPIEI
ncbi:coiled-coil domain-containing protein 146 isoform X2 [Tiliqua scincoides]|uniref:coiled-coil domain-containing protein 146 isoform X2 n=1 Tax=Tiliqua scincoides TaxID=71010 RepID=UPI0034631044